MFPSVICLAALLLSLVLSPAADQPLQLLPNCRFLPTDWADGDSFRIQTPDGTQLTVRLYGADCLESRATDESDARRLREQRRYFGIAAVGGSSAASSQLAQSFGRQASAATAAALSQPFSLHTSFADARGDSTFQRVYGFITTHTGADLDTDARADGHTHTGADGDVRPLLSHSRTHEWQPQVQSLLLDVRAAQLPLPSRVRLPAQIPYHRLGRHRRHLRRQCLAPR